jgi:hypothetical protein
MEPVKCPRCPGTLRRTSDWSRFASMGGWEADAECQTCRRRERLWGGGFTFSGTTPPSPDAIGARCHCGAALRHRDGENWVSARDAPDDRRRYWEMRAICPAHGSQRIRCVETVSGGTVTLSQT